MIQGALGPYSSDTYMTDGRVWGLAAGALGRCSSCVRRQKAQGNTSASLALSFNPGPQPVTRDGPHSGQLFPPSPSLPGNAPVCVSNGESHV